MFYAIYKVFFFFFLLAYMVFQDGKKCPDFSDFQDFFIKTLSNTLWPAYSLKLQIPKAQTDVVHSRQ